MTKPTCNALLFLLVAACGEVTTGGGGAAPSISAVSPDRGGLPGGSTVTLTGTGFSDGDAGANNVVVGGKLATEIDVVDDATLTFTLPPGPAEGAAVDVVVFNNRGVAIATAAITYNPVPLVIGLSATSGGSTGGNTITLTGRGFADNAAGELAVRVGGSDPAIADVTSDTEATVAMPARADSDPAFEALDVILANANGEATLPASYRYTAKGVLAMAARGITTGFFLDPETYELRRIASFGSRISGLVVNADDQLVALWGNCCQKNVGPLDLFSGSQGAVGNTGQQMRDLAIIGTELFGYSSGAQLFSIDPATAASTPIGATLAGVDGRSMAFTARDENSLYVVAELDGPIRLVNKATGVATLGPTMNGPAGLMSHAALVVDGALWVVGHTRNNASQLFSVDPETGEVTKLADLSRNIAALSVTPASFE